MSSQGDVMEIWVWRMIDAAKMCTSVKDSFRFGLMDFLDSINYFFISTIYNYNVSILNVILPLHKRNSQNLYFPFWTYFCLSRKKKKMERKNLYYFQKKMFWWIPCLCLIRYAFRWLKLFKHVLEVNESSTTKLENGLFSLLHRLPIPLMWIHCDIIENI